jgi:hypothetical protein
MPWASPTGRQKVADYLPKRWRDTKRTASPLDSANGVLDIQPTSVDLRPSNDKSVSYLP